MSVSSYGVGNNFQLTVQYLAENGITLPGGMIPVTIKSSVEINEGYDDLYDRAKIINKPGMKTLIIDARSACGSMAHTIKYTNDIYLRGWVLQSISHGEEIFGASSTVTGCKMNTRMAFELLGIKFRVHMKRTDIPFNIPMLCDYIIDLDRNAYVKQRDGRNDKGRIIAACYDWDEVSDAYLSCLSESLEIAKVPPPYEKYKI